LVLIRADRIIEGEVVDILYDGTQHQFLFNKTAPVDNHRTKRDAFSSATAAFLAQGQGAKEAIEAARDFVLPSRLVSQA